MRSLLLALAFASGLPAQSGSVTYLKPPTRQCSGISFTVLGQPTLGQTLTFHGAPAYNWGMTWATLVVALGVSEQAYLGVPLPVRLPLHPSAGGCWVMVSPDILLKTKITGGVVTLGYAEVSVPVPNVAAMVGLSFYAQGWHHAHDRFARPSDTFWPVGAAKITLGR